ncbi:MBL fold metallo-hydrolase [Allorhodopirellula solitaria]|uniref:Ribonuclease Z n=1 Tax=Allorhodopirellula solitaria TaxID=2527987 RepID=A0A5C5XQA3_9BACT|nr:MBL fold metallo-hydrolase [Allorhodopirellula solitaria]TWT64769.1 ribonuclease Z [Allorhodopirellula solitaria]
MQLHCLGTAGYHPNESRHTSCYFLPESGIVLDAGTGMFRLPGLIQTDHLDVLLSHAHLDHIVGLTFLLGIVFQHPVERIRVWGEAEKIAAVQKLMLSETIFPAALPVSWHAIDRSGSDAETPLEIAGAQVSWRHQEHPGGSVAYRIDWPANRGPLATDGPARALVYATDTTGATDPSVLQWMQGANVLLHECNFHDHQREWARKTGHCYLERVAEVSAAAAAQRVLLTHISPIDPISLQPNDSRFAMPCEIVDDQQVIEF